jgi:hypothetical protein
MDPRFHGFQFGAQVVRIQLGRCPAGYTQEEQNQAEVN